MSTSLLVTKMQKSAEAKGLDVSIEAYPEATMEKELDDVDAVLIGPQIKYLLKKLKKFVMKRCANKCNKYYGLWNDGWGKGIKSSFKMME